MMLARPSFLTFSAMRRSCTSFTQSQTGQVYVRALLLAWSRTPHWAQENSSTLFCSAWVLMGS